MQQIDGLKNDTIEMAKTWQTAVETFNSTVQLFREFIESATEYKSLVGATYIGFDMNVTISNEIFNGAFYADLDVTTLETKQAHAIQFVRESSENFASVNAMLRGRVVFYRVINQEYGKSKTVASILNSCKISTVIGAAESEVGHIHIHPCTFASTRAHGRTHSHPTVHKVGHIRIHPCTR